MLSELSNHIPHLNQPFPELFRGPQVNLVFIVIFNFNLWLLLPLFKQFVHSSPLAAEPFVLDIWCKLKFKSYVLANAVSNLVRLNNQWLNLCLNRHNNVLFLSVLLLTLFLTLLEYFLLLKLLLKRSLLPLHFHCCQLELPLLLFKELAVIQLFLPHLVSGPL